MSLKAKITQKILQKSGFFLILCCKKKYHVREGQPFKKSVLYKIGKIKLLNRTLRDLIWLLYGQIQHINKIQARQKYKYMHIAYRWKKCRVIHFLQSMFIQNEQINTPVY